MSKQCRVRARLIASARPMARPGEAVQGEACAPVRRETQMRGVARGGRYVYACVGAREGVPRAAEPALQCAGVACLRGVVWASRRVHGVR